MASIGLLGPLSVDGDAGRLPPRERAVLAVLAVRRGDVVSAETLADAWWGERPPPTWPKAIQGCIVQLRKVLGAAAIETRSPGYRLVLPSEAIDADRFVSQLARARELLILGDPDRASYVVDDALALWRGRALIDVESWAAGQTEARRLEELRLDAEELRIDAALRAGRFRDVLAEATTRVAEAPLREHRWVLLALAQYQAGRQGDALRTLRAARETLIIELGLDPGADIVTLEHAILRHDPSLVAARLPALSPTCPYLGLVPYDVSDAERFFGRERDIEECLRRLAATGVLAIVGPSGSGKSSLVRAGVAAALERRGQRVVVVTPGASPSEALGALPTGRPPVLVVDQCEEAVTLCDDASAQTQFFAALARHAEVAPLVVVWRADRLGDLSGHPTFAAIVERGLFLLTSMDESGLRTAIVGPARQAGLLLEPGLVDLLVRDADGEPGALPLLSHALRQSWQRREGRTLTVSSYQASGGIRGAVAQSAEQVYEQAPVEQRTVLRDVLLRLVAPSPEGEPRCSRVPRWVLATDAEHERMIEELVRARLITSDRDMVELAHAAVARAWPRLREWLDDDAEGQRMWRHLSTAAASWEAMGYADSELYRGARLQQAMEWRAGADVELNPSERAFLDASHHQADAERDAARRRRQVFTVLVGGAAVLALVLGSIAVVQARRSAEERDRAVAAEDQARLEALVDQSLALRATDRAVGALLAVEAHRRAPSDARPMSALLGTFTAAPGFMGYIHLPDDQPLATAALLPDASGAVVAVGGALQVLDLETGSLDPRFAGAEGATPSLVRVSADGRYVAAVSSPPSPTLAVHDVRTGRPVLGPLDLPTTARGLAISADGGYVAVAGDDGAIALVHTADAAEVGAIAPTAGTDAATVAFGADGLLISGSVTGSVRAIDPATMAIVATIDAPPRSTNVNLVATAGGLLVGSGDDALVALDVARRTVRWAVDIGSPGDPAPCTALAVASSVGRIYCGNRFGMLEERDIVNGQRTGARLDPQTGSVAHLAVSADGQQLVAFGGDAPVASRWALDGGGPIVIGGADDLLAERYDPTGRFLVVVDSDPANPLDAAVWDPVEGDVVDDLEDIGGVPIWQGAGILGAAFTDGTLGTYDVNAAVRTAHHVAAAAPPGRLSGATMSAGGTRIYVTYVDDQDGTTPQCQILTFDVATARFTEPTLDIAGCTWVASVAATPDAGRIAITYATPTSSSWTTMVRDGRTGEQVSGPLLGLSTTDIAPDGTLVGGRGTGEIVQYDLETLQPVGTFPGVRGAVDQLRFSADGALLLVGSRNQILAIYDVATRTRLGDPIATEAPFDGPKGELRPDGKAVAINRGDGFRIWDLDPDHLAEAACRLAGRNLTGAEWATYLGSQAPYRDTCPTW